MSEDSTRVLYVKSFVGILETIVAVLLLIAILQLVGLTSRMDRFIDEHDSDMVRMASSAHARNQAIRIIAAQTGASREQVEEALSQDWLVNDPSFWKHGHGK